VIRNVRPWGGETVDLDVTDGVVSGVSPAVRAVTASASVPTESDIDGGGRILLPGFTDAHVHLDSTRLGLPFRPFTGGANVLEQVMNDRANWRSAEASVAERSTYTLGQSILRGVTRARSYAQIDTDCRLERFEGVLAAKEAHREHVTMEIMAFPQAGVIRDPGTVDLLDEALANGADTVGGIDPCALDRDPAGQLDAVFALAEKHQCTVDIHLHEPGELGLFTIGLILERVAALDMRGRVTVSHAFSLGEATGDRIAPVLDAFAEWDVALTTIAPTPERRLPLREIVSRGIRIGLGQDGQRDYWSPYGNADMLDRTWLLAWSNGFRADADVELCAAIATIGGASIMPDLRAQPIDYFTRSIELGDAADFVLAHGETVTSAVMDRVLGRQVVRAGRLIVDGDAFVGTDPSAAFPEVPGPAASAQLTGPA
jgi:cytosine/adenosine deaminase-related metal-dependent hydrolase